MNYYGQGPSQPPDLSNNPGAKFAALGVIILLAAGFAAYFYVQQSEEEVYEMPAEEIYEDYYYDEVEPTVLEASFGEELTFDMVKIAFNEVTEVQSYVDQFDEEFFASEGAKFLFVDMSVENITKDPLVFWSLNFSMVDDLGRTFDYYDAWWHADTLNVRTLAPNILEKGVLAFEVPEDAVLSELHIIEDFHDLDFEGYLEFIADEYVIKLGM